jgi:predicted membrane-bound spermidine synthase
MGKKNFFRITTTVFSFRYCNLRLGLRIGSRSFGELSFGRFGETVFFIIGVYLFSMGVGSYFAKFIKKICSKLL